MVQFFTENQFSLLKAIAKDSIVAQPTSGKFIKEHKLSGASSVKAALKILEDKELVYRTNKGYIIYATEGTHRFLMENGVESTLCYWPSEEGTPQALELLHSGDVDLVININKNLTPGELTNGYKLRRAAIDHNIPLITNARLASAYIHSFCTIEEDSISISPWSSFVQ